MPRRANAFRVRPVMTASIRLHVFRTFLFYNKSHFLSTLSRTSIIYQFPTNIMTDFTYSSHSEHFLFIYYRYHTFRKLQKTTFKIFFIIECSPALTSLLSYTFNTSRKNSIRMGAVFSFYFFAYHKIMQFSALFRQLQLARYGSICTGIG